jgi:hypothetical protein
MGYTLEAIIGSWGVLRAAVRSQPAAALVSLPQNLAMVPMTDALVDAVTDASSQRLLGFRKLPAGFDRVLSAWSYGGPVAYIEASFFALIGSQRAALWADGRLALGPLSVDEGEPFVDAGSPISQVLRHLGVRRANYHDEFEAIGLNHRRRTADWVG